MIPETRKIKLAPGESVIAIKPVDGGAFIYSRVEVIIALPPSNGTRRYRQESVHIYHDEPSHHVSMLFDVYREAEKAMMGAIWAFVEDGSIPREVAVAPEPVDSEQGQHPVKRGR